MLERQLTQTQAEVVVVVAVSLGTLIYHKSIWAELAEAEAVLQAQAYKVETAGAL